MKTLFSYCRQPRAYADSQGKMLIELENDETIQDVIEEYIKLEHMWYEQYYSDPKEVNEYVYNGVAYSGRLVLLKTHQAYLD